MDETDDFGLLEAWARGDRDAGDVLLGRHFASLFRFFHTKLDVDSEDLAQRTLLACLGARLGFRGESSFRVFLLGIARRQLLLFLRERARDARREAAHQRLTPPRDAETPSKVVGLREEQRLLVRALHRLPLALQMTIELHYWEQLSVDEIGAVLDIPAGTVKSRLFRGRELLREHIAAIAASPDLAASTLGGLDTWVAAIGHQALAQGETRVAAD